MLGDLGGADAGPTGISKITEILEADGKTYTGTVTYDTIKVDWLKLQQDDFDKMAKSVAKYKGFYISRYEVGEGGASKKNQTIMTHENNKQMWWGLFKNVRSDNTGMIWGSQYDQVMRFIGEEAKIGHNNRNIEAEEQKSGYNPLDKMKNIFDLEGNYYEATAEAAENKFRVERGRIIQCYSI